MTKSSKRRVTKANRDAARVQARQKQTRRTRTALAAVLVSLAFGVGSDSALGDGVGGVMTAKSIPDSTVALIDPESGTSVGGSGSDVNLALGDIILFRFALTPVPNAALNGMAGYLTEYIPNGTDVVGVRIIDANGQTVIPQYPGQTRDGCHSNNTCNYSVLDGFGPLTDGSISQHIAETGVFFSTDPRTAKNPASSFLTTDNGIVMTDEPIDIARVNNLLGDSSGPFRAHNAWDYRQIEQFGDVGGNTRHLYGSPVAGPDTHYPFEMTTVGTFDNNTGPWQRILYPGSTEGVGSGGDGVFGILARALQDATGVGADVTPANPAGGGALVTAVRYALGEMRTGVPMFAEIALRVTTVPFFDTNFVDPVTGPGGNVDCAEVTGSDLSAVSAGGRGQNNLWNLYMGSPACVFLRNKIDVKAEKTRALSGEVVNFVVSGSNLSTTEDTNVNVCLKSNGLTFVNDGSASPAPTSQTCNASLCGDLTGMTCVIYNLGTLDSGEDYSISLNYSLSGGNGTDAAPLQAVYSSDRIPAASGGFKTQDVVITTGVPVMDINMDITWDALTQFANYSSNTFGITGNVTNIGTRRYGPSELILYLPTGWRIRNTGGAGTEDIIIDGATKECSGACNTNTPRFPFDNNEDMDPFGATASLPFSFTLVIPAGTDPELFNIDAAVEGSSQTFGANSESYFREVVAVNVGAVRSAPPDIDCAAFGSTSTSIPGIADPDDEVDVKFNLINRLTATADGTTGVWNADDAAEFALFGSMYGGLEVSATAHFGVPGVTPDVDLKLESELSNRCEVSGVRECSDGLNNDGAEDSLIDFPNDPGCDSPSDNSEADDPLPECSDGINNDGAEDALIDFPADPGCSSPDDDSEGGSPECSDLVDNDADGLLDFAGGDTGCTDANDPIELDLPQCMDGIDNDGAEDVLIDFAGGDPGCISAFDDDETNEAPSTDIKARLLVVMDTSGSMNFNTCNDTFTGGDGSTECPGLDVDSAVCASDTSSNGDPDDSRLAKVKTGMNNVIAGFGEVEFGLMRFAQRAEEFACPSVFASLRSGGWQGGGEICGGANLFNEGELLVGFSSENQDELLAWMDGESNYPGIDPEIVPAGMDHELRGSGTTPIAGSLDSALLTLNNERVNDAVGACRPYSVVLVTDGAETCGGDPADRAAALLADGFTVYVIGFATTDQSIIDDLDAIAFAGGTGSAIVVDDSAALSQAMADIVSDTILTERCNGLDDDCDNEIDEDFPALGNVCDNGQPSVCFREGEVVCAADQLGVECDAATVAPGVEVCNGLDDDCDLVIDNGFPEPCICVPTLEICNGIDDDCDSATDEDTVDDPLPGVGQSCGFDEGICVSGTLSCPAGDFVCDGVIDPELEDDINVDCDGDDNDCDSIVDEVTVACYDPDDNDLTTDLGCDLGTGVCLGLCQTGLRSCLIGPPFGAGLCQNDIGPLLEICDGLDNDCDGVNDNGFPVGTACTNGQLGQCLINGTIICDPTDSEGDGDFVQCTAFPIPTGVEICNGLDDDCDGLTDETVSGPLPAPIGNACGGNGTFCGAGTIICQNGAPVCSGAGGGTDETCNGIDDDCDGPTDEDTPGQPLLGVGEQCYPFATGCDLGAGTCEGSCDFGATICQNGGPFCEGATGPAVEETCNGADDDCDGEVDEAATCPAAGDICFEGECVGPCGAGEFPCPLDFFCQSVPNEGDFCTLDPCAILDCLDTELCDSDLGACFDPCQTNNTCPAGTECLLGGCFDCFDAGFACAEDENCVIGANPGVGECVTDPCFFTECQEGQFCSGGDCLNITCTPACSASQTCLEGTCIDDLCAGVECGARICNPSSGECVADVCENKFCPQGTACNPGTGECINDPCLEIDCPAPLACQVSFEGTGQCVEVIVPDPEGEFVSAGGGGGCTCTSSGSGSGPASGSLLLFGLVALLLRRRRARACSES